MGFVRSNGHCTDMIWAGKGLNMNVLMTQGPSSKEKKEINDGLWRNPDCNKMVSKNVDKRGLLRLTHTCPR